jgi:hypothetical protein
MQACAVGRNGQHHPHVGGLLKEAQPSTFTLFHRLANHVHEHVAGGNAKPKQTRYTARSSELFVEHLLLDNLPVHGTGGSLGRWGIRQHRGGSLRRAQPEPRLRPLRLSSTYSINNLLGGGVCWLWFRSGRFTTAGQAREPSWI